MNSTAQTVAIFIGIIGAYIWLNIPGLVYFSPQLAAAFCVLYFLLRVARKKHYLPLSISKATPEFALLSTAVLLLIGSTGNLDSFFFPLAYLHIFFLTMSLKPFQAISVSTALLCFHYSMMTTLNSQYSSELVSLFMMLFIFLFAKRQYEERIREVQIINDQKQRLAIEKSKSVSFLSGFLKPKLVNLLHLVEYAQANQEVIQKQLILMQNEVDQFIELEEK